MDDLITNSLNLSVSEVEVDIPLVLQISAVLRHMGYPVRSVMRETRDPEIYWSHYIGSEEEVQIGKNYTRTKTRSVSRVIGSWFKRAERIEEEYLEHYVNPVAIVKVHNDQILILCSDSNAVSYLREIGDLLQQTFAKKVVLKLTRIDGIPTIQTLQSLPISTVALTMTGVDVVNLLASQINKRLKNEAKVIDTSNGSLQAQVREGDRALLSLTLNSSPADPVNIDISCVVYREDLTQILVDEIAGVIETIRPKGKELTYKIEEKY